MISDFKHMKPKNDTRESQNDTSHPFIIIPMKSTCLKLKTYVSIYEKWFIPPSIIYSGVLQRDIMNIKKVIYLWHIQHIIRIKM